MNHRVMGIDWSGAVAGAAQKIWLAEVRDGEVVRLEAGRGRREMAEHLIEEAEKRRRVLMVDHTFLYTSAVRKIKELIDQGNLGQLYYYDSVRVNLGIFQHDVNVLWDLAVHDLSIMDFVLGRAPTVIAATASSVPFCGRP